MFGLETFANLNQALACFAVGIGLLAFSIFRANLAVYVGAAFAFLGVIVAGDVGEAGGWIQAAAGVMVVYCVIQMFGGKENA